MRALCALFPTSLSAQSLSCGAPAGGAYICVLILLLYHYICVLMWCSKYSARNICMLSKLRPFRRSCSRCDIRHTIIYMCPHTTNTYYKFVLILLYMLSKLRAFRRCCYSCICVLILLYVSSYYYICVLILLHLCPHTSTHVSSYFYICVRPHTTICASSYYCTCVLILLCI